MTNWKSEPKPSLYVSSGIFD